VKENEGKHKEGYSKVSLFLSIKWASKAI
jgi:hypothetical protein